jgi:hypothetical protein
MTPEGAVKAKIKDTLKELQCYYFCPPANGYGRSGIPDFVGCLSGMFFSIEAKAGKGRTTALQDREIQRIKDAGGIALVINESNIDTLKEKLQLMTREYG